MKLIKRYSPLPLTTRPMRSNRPRLENFLKAVLMVVATILASLVLTKMAFGLLKYILVSTPDGFFKPGLPPGVNTGLNTVHVDKVWKNFRDDFIENEEGWPVHTTVKPSARPTLANIPKVKPTPSQIINDQLRMQLEPPSQPLPTTTSLRILKFILKPMPTKILPTMRVETHQLRPYRPLTTSSKHLATTAQFRKQILPFLTTTKIPQKTAPFSRKQF